MSIFSLLICLLFFIVNIDVVENSDFLWLLILHPVIFLLTIGWIVSDYLKFGSWFNITNFVLLLIYIYFGLGSLYYITNYDTIPHDSLRYSSYALTTFWLICCATFFYKIGSISPISNYLAKFFPVKNITPIFTNRIRLGILISFFITIVIKLYLINIGSYGFMIAKSGDSGNNLLTLLKLFEIPGMMGILVGYYYWFSTTSLSKFDKLIIILFTVITLGFALLTGMKAKILYASLLVIIPSIFIGRLQGRRIVSLKIYTVLISLFLIYWVVNPVIRSVMVQNQSNDIIQSTFDTVSAITSNDFSFSKNNASIDDNINIVWERISLFRYFNSVVAQTGGNNGVAYRAWDRYVYLPVAFIPRILIPDKPVNNYSAQFNLDYISDIYNSTTPSMIGWAYMESGVFSLIILMFLLGVIHGSIDKYSSMYGRLSVFSVMVFSIFFQKVANIEPDPFWIFNGLYQEIFIIIFCYYLFFAKFKFK